MNNESKLIKKCPYCGQEFSFDEDEVKWLDEDTCAIKCKKCGKSVDVTEEIDRIQYKLTPKGIMACCLMESEDLAPSLRDYSMAEISEVAESLLNSFMDGMMKSGYLIKPDEDE